jgi:hypothetical protein
MRKNEEVARLFVEFALAFKVAPYKVAKIYDFLRGYHPTFEPALIDQNPAGPASLAMELFEYFFTGERFNPNTWWFHIITKDQENIPQPF